MRDHDAAHPAHDDLTNDDEPDFMALDRFAPIALTFDDVLLLPGETDVIPSDVDTTARLTRDIDIAMPLRLGGHGHRHRGADGDRDGAAGRHRRPAPQPVHRRPGRAGRPGQALRVRHGQQSGHRRAGRHAGRRRRAVRPVPHLRACRSSTTGACSSASSPTATCASSAVGVGHPPGARGHDADAAGHRAGRDRPRRRGARCSPSTRSRSCRSSTPTGPLRGLITVKDFVKSEQFPDATKDGAGRLRVAAAVGFWGDAWERATALVDAGVDVLVRRHRATARPA